MNRTSITIVCAVMGVSLRGVANPAADQAVRDAEAKAAKGDFVGAAGKFREAYAADGKAEYLCDIGVAYQKAKTELPRAHLFLRRCQERDSVLERKFVEAMRKKVIAVEAELRAGNYTPIDISIEPKTAGVTISAFGADEGFVGPRAIWLPYGKHQITFSADGYVTETVDVEAASHASKLVELTLKRKPVEVGAGSGSGSGSDAGSAAGSGSDAGSGSGSAVVGTGSGSGSGAISVEVPTTPPRPTKILPIATTAVTVAALATAIVTFRSGHNRADISQFAITSGTFQSDKRYVDRQNTYMGIAGSVAIIGAGISGYLWYRALHAPSTRVEVNATGSGAGVSVTGRF